MTFLLRAFWAVTLLPLAGMAAPVGGLAGGADGLADNACGLAA